MRVRTRSYAIFVTIGLLAGCSSLHVNSSQVRSAQGWLTEGQSAHRTHAVATPLTPPLDLKWNLDAGAGFGIVSPLIVDQLVFVANRKGEVHAIELATGRRVGQSSFGESIEGTPVYEAGVLYVPVGWGRRSLVSYDLLRGHRRWTVSGAPISSGLLTYADVVIAADDDGKVRAYAMDDGQVEWTVDLGDGIGVKASPVLAGGLVIVADDRGRVFALNPVNGSVEWSTDAGAPILSTPCSDDESVYFATTRGRFVKLQVEDGSRMWTYDAERDDVYFAAPAMSEKHVVFGASDGRVRAIDKSSGQEVWSQDVDAAITAAPLLTDRVAYVGTMHGKLIALDRKSGTNVWEYELGGRVKSAFAASGRSLVVLAEPRTAYLFESTSDGYALNHE